MEKYTIKTTTAAEDLVSGMLMDLGMEGVQIEDNIQLSESDTKAMFVDILPELPPDEGIGMVSFILKVIMKEFTSRKELKMKKICA